MAPVFADQPFQLLHTPSFQLAEGEKADMFTDLADEMVLVHNALIRCLNAIWLQAPYISEEESIAFANFANCWHRFVKIHHDGEESLFFPAIERLTGEQGIMDININQHHAFHDGLDRFGVLVHDVLSSRIKFNGDALVQIINDFGPALTEHLHGEIDTLIGLRRFGVEKMAPLTAVMQQQAQAAMKKIGFVSGLPWFHSIHDRQYEYAKWKDFPPEPSTQVILFITRTFTFWIHSDWWKFGPCDRHGTMRSLHACAK